MPRRRDRRDRIEFAKTDRDLIDRFRWSTWLRGEDYAIPQWLNSNATLVDGDPSLIRERRLGELREGHVKPSNDNELRYIRNKIAILNVYQQSRSQQPDRVSPYRLELTGPQEHQPDRGKVDLLQVSPGQKKRATIVEITDDDEEVVFVSSKSCTTSQPLGTVTPASTRARRGRDKTAKAGKTALLDAALSVHQRQREADQVVPEGAPPVHLSVARYPTRLATLQRQGLAQETLPAGRATAGFTSRDSASALARSLKLERRRDRKQQRKALATQSASKNDKAAPAIGCALQRARSNIRPAAAGVSNLHPAEDLPEAWASGKRFRSGTPKQKHYEQHMYNDRPAPVHQIIIPQTGPAIEQLADDLLRLEHDRIKQHGNPIIIQQPEPAPEQLADDLLRLQNDRLKQDKAALSRTLRWEVGMRQDLAIALRSLTKMNKTLLAKTMIGGKRKASRELPNGVGEEGNDNDNHDIGEYMLQLANKIGRDLDQAVANETIHMCGLAPLRIIATHPKDVLTLAYKHLLAKPFSTVAIHWRRLYEDASLHLAVKLLRSEAAAFTPVAAGSSKRRKADKGLQGDDWVSEIVEAFDKALSLTGAPARRHVFEDALQELGKFANDTEELPATFRIRRPGPLASDHPIAVAEFALGFEAFQHWLNNEARPLIIPGTMTGWAATKQWHDPNYLLRLTMGGRRFVPVEVGESYTDEDWSQQCMPVGVFMRTFLLPDDPAKVGYLAQHDLFAQIPALKSDVSVPDYCYTTPPAADEYALKTAGLKLGKALDEPMLNAWLGPKGTKTPLHTDPYHNVLCQVVGYKYVRLYPPSQTPKLYPRGVDEAGIDMQNTSFVDVKHVRPRSLGGNIDLDAIEELEKLYPLFQEAEYEEALLGPGECLYIPLGWWHYVESLSTSFSVSFWWS
ncbi:hypothetical protein LTR08_002474 [Meristemomyces frigidus]|nr:hypothetical protein LTR08_002474 [Meristemomyces frigidus]